MIEKLSIRNFKSVRELDLSCRRVNVFIGEPNAGKTNILEALGLWSFSTPPNLKEVCRVSRAADLFYEQRDHTDIFVRLDDATLRAWKITTPGTVRFALYLTPSSEEFDELKPNQEFEIGPEGITYTTMYSSSTENPGDHVLLLMRTRHYLFKTDPEPGKDGRSHDETLSTPFGANLPALLAADRRSRQTVAAFFGDRQYKLTIDKSSGSVLLAREDDGTLVTLPYKAASETLRRMAFFHLAIDTNENRLLIFDEPEAHAYPPYTKILAEKMAQDDRGNQFFLTTHSPYMLTSLIEKTPMEDLNVVLCRMENFETKTYVMTDAQKVQLMEWGMNAFYNFDRLVDDEP